MEIKTIEYTTVTDDFSKELLIIIDESFTLMRQEIVTLRNDLAQHKLEFVQIKHEVNRLNRDQEKRYQLSSAVVVAMIAAVASVTAAMLNYFKG